MARDPYLNHAEKTEWTGRPEHVRVTPLFSAVAAVMGILAISTLCFALVVATALHVKVGGMLFFSAWCSTIALVAWRGPLLWRLGENYTVTGERVISKRGRFRRSIGRHEISYAIIRWDDTRKGVGDLTLVRAVPTGALRRTLSITLSGIRAPDRVWAIVRGLTPTASCGDGDLPLAQRLDEGERVLWSGIPHASPWTVRRTVTLLISLVLAGASARMLVGGISALRRIVRTHALPPATLVVLIAGIFLGLLLVAASAVVIAHRAWLFPRSLAQKTRYFVTDRRVLIKRGTEELHLERERIYDVIAAPSGSLVDLHLVLDGPRARALAASGAFQSRDPEALRPVFTAIEDADTACELLKPSESLPRAA